jgi:simple sugar transport system ATP-binding protein
MEISDRVAVLRARPYVGTLETAETSPRELTDRMVGRAVSLDIERPDPENPERRLLVENLSCVNGEGSGRFPASPSKQRAGRSWASPGSRAAGKRSCARPSRASSRSPAAASAIIRPPAAFPKIWWAKRRFPSGSWA